MIPKPVFPIEGFAQLLLFHDFPLPFRLFCSLSASGVLPRLWWDIVVLSITVIGVIVVVIVFVERLFVLRPVNLGQKSV